MTTMPHAMLKDDGAAGPVILTLMVLGGLVGAAVATGGVMYAVDYRLDATITGKDCFGSLRTDASKVSIQTKMFSIDYTLEHVPLDICNQVQPGNFVTYHIRSKHTTLYASEGGVCIYDSETGIGC